MDQIIIHFYSDLVSTLPMDDACFRSRLHSANLLPGNLKAEIHSKPTRADKAEYFLDHGIKNNSMNFKKLLEILENWDDQVVINLSKQIRNEIDEKKFGNTSG